MEYFFLLLQNHYTLVIVSIGAALLGTVSGALGTYAVLRRQSLLGDAISHAALPGIAIAFMLTGTKTHLILIIGAAIAGWLGSLVILSIVRLTRIKYDSALALILSTFFGFGLVLHTFIQRTGNANQAGLDKFLFGQAATMLKSDVLTIGILGGVALILMLIFWKELKLLIFDEGFAASIGFPIRSLDFLLTSLLVIAIVIGLQAVGAVLMSAMLVAPAVAARQWTNRLSLMVIIAAAIGAFSGVIGTIISSMTTRIPTGPTIILCTTVIVGFSIVFAPNRGLLSNIIRQMKNRRIFKRATRKTVLGERVQHESNSHVA
ncbi:metal ABC transporter permease [Candidatus Poribacteria bacterium]|nr:metal ABC transporter permease [Candidatus Poribacteria bacterium]MYB63564.1 metal ABC transporter permease [Candidatus Poribacteria bacterium]MYF56543.1 metal ABC transporter permease [Candidatus Poribacteria bacterium]